MKVIVLIVSCLLLSTVTMAEQEVNGGTDYQGEFFQGMETGFFLRDTPDGHKEYECPEPSIDQDMIKKINAVLGPVQMLLKLAESDMLDLALRMVDTVVNSVFNIVGSIENYRGSEFCSGLLFGQAGSNLVLKLGRDIMMVNENIDNMAKKYKR